MSGLNIFIGVLLVLSICLIQWGIQKKSINRNGCTEHGEGFIAWGEFFLKVDVLLAISAICFWFVNDWAIFHGVYGAWYSVGFVLVTFILILIAYAKSQDC